MRVFGLTGGIGTGKGLVASVLRVAGVAVVDADRIARRVVEPGTEGYGEVVAAFGEGILLPGGAIDRKGLGAIVFSDPAARARLEAITLPRIRAAIREELARLEAEGRDAAFVEAALLVENRRTGEYEAVVGVRCGKEEQVRRIAARDGLSGEEIRMRLASQMDPEEKARGCDHVIDNSGSPEETAVQVRDLLYRLKILPLPVGPASR
jgi:dephospho-CoA kinase